MNIEPKPHPTLTFTLKNKYKITEPVTSISLVYTTPTIPPTTIYTTPTHIHISNISPSLLSIPYIHTLSLCISNINLTVTHNCIILSKPFTSTHNTVMLIEPYSLRHITGVNGKSNNNGGVNDKSNNNGGVNDKSNNNGGVNGKSNNNGGVNGKSYDKGGVNESLNNIINDKSNSINDRANDQDITNILYPNLFLDIPLKYSTHTIYPFIFFYSNTDIIICYYDNNRVLLHSHIANISKVIIYNKGVCSVSVEGVISVYIVGCYLYVVSVPFIPMEVFIYYNDVLMFVDNTMYVYRGIIKGNGDDKDKDRNTIDAANNTTTVDDHKDKDRNTIDTANNTTTVDDHKDILIFKNIFLSNPSKVNIVQVGTLILLSIPEDSTIFILDNTYTHVQPEDEINSISVRMNEEYEYCVINGVVCDGCYIYLYDNYNVVCIWEYKDDNNMVSDKKNDYMSDNSAISYTKDNIISDNTGPAISGISVEGKCVILCKELLELGFTVNNSSLAFNKDVIGCTVIPLINVAEEDVCGVTPLDEEAYGLKGVSDYRGVSDSSDKQQGVKNSNDKQQGVSDSNDLQQGVNENIYKQQDVSQSNNKQRGVSDSNYKQQGVIQSNDEQQGVKDTNTTFNNSLDNLTNFNDEELRRIKESIMDIKVDKKNIRTYSYFVEEQMERIDSVLQRMYKKMRKCEEIKDNPGYFYKLIGILRHRIMSYTFLSLKGVRNSVEYFEDKIFNTSGHVYDEGVIYGREMGVVVYDEGVSFKKNEINDNVVVDIEERLKAVTIGEGVGGVNYKDIDSGLGWVDNRDCSYKEGVNNKGSNIKGISNKDILEGVSNKEAKLEDKLKGFNITTIEDNYKGVNTNESLPINTPFNQVQNTNTLKGVNTDNSLPINTPFNQVKNINTLKGVIDTDNSLPINTPFNQVKNTNTLKGVIDTNNSLSTNTPFNHIFNNPPNNIPNTAQIFSNLNTDTTDIFKKEINSKPLKNEKENTVFKPQNAFSKFMSGQSNLFKKYEDK